MYHFIDKLYTLYGLLQDDQSKGIFQARFALDMERSLPNIKRLVSLGSCQERSNCLERKQQLQTELLKQLGREGKKIILYGTASRGRSVARMLESEHVSFYGFCGRGAKHFPNGLLGKPVLSPDELVANGDEYYVVLVFNSKKSYTEVSKFLQEHNYPENHILDWVDTDFFTDEEHQYFEFPALYRRGTAFIDGGCYNCETSYQFAEWCGGEYSSIIAFEPDTDNYTRCCQKVQDVPLPNFRLINAGLSSEEGTAVFDASNTPRSRIISSLLSAKFHVKSKSENEISIHTVAIDGIVGDSEVGFIKMDIEGAEFDALHGAKNTIIRNKPLLAICVYHLRGDVFAIMDYLHQLLPEYRFLLRHYSPSADETVLYASVDL